MSFQGTSRTVSVVYQYHLIKCIDIFAPFPYNKSVRSYSNYIIPFSLRELVDALRERGAEVYLVSGGFDCLIVPEAKKCGIAPNHVIANTILFDKEGSSSNCICCDL